MEYYLVHNYILINYSFDFPFQKFLDIFIHTDILYWLWA